MDVDGLLLNGLLDGRRGHLTIRMTWTSDHSVDHKPSREAPFPYYNISNFTHCTGLKLRDMGINAGLAIYTSWKFCCGCAQRTISAYKREEEPNGYQLIATPCYFEPIWYAVERIVKKELKERKVRS
ncbi:unnamed protein product [Cylicocyclus nassatus]|uniref:Uncharacterized protein n=1 Tax=Cylicocyclus nassatus TaxID=53992 RepID=A0AA36GN26_CYLNA|nr:unnamed protein product [Cylicocyclus nassatus]